MSEPTKERLEGFKQAIDSLEKSPETLALNFYEATPVNKRLFTIVPSPYDIRLTKISYNFGCLDLSSNGYVQVVISKVLNPNIYGTLEQNSNIVFSKMGGAGQFVEGDSHFFDNVVLGKNEPHYVYLISNIPTAVGVIGRLALYYNPLWT